MSPMGRPEGESGPKRVSAEGSPVMVKAAAVACARMDAATRSDARTILGAFLGSLLMAIIADALTLLGVNPYWNNVVIGGALLAAVLVDTLNKRRKGQL